ncbi:UvrD-helicase domain-containing protein [Methanothermobacter thermautotrophicus]|uniref:UvrD-helicase domain-containing protein n=1 Tax=Methanothermobacter thermautotrophicus TaxID=145262 RepID=UPI0022B86684|nr:UvrD-helicase domain-containing protein [Methanothermobacter thermautotrophicus]WBF06780.1 UvrD-helicase domain-containing protein [Methanothermobacter thermautotrophicus]
MTGEIQLTDEQRRAVEHFTGPLLVVAGPGAGKTRIIVERVAHLIDERGAEPSSLVVITFTRKAADELKERIIRRVGGRAEEMQISTIHSFCNRILRMYPDHHTLGSNFHVLDEENQLMFIYEHREQLGLGNVQRERFPLIQGFFSECQENMVDPETLIQHYRNKGAGRFEMTVAEAYQRYLNLMDENGLLDFAGMQWRVVRLLENDSKILDDLRSRYRFLMVDEYQDTNQIQERFLELLAGEECNIFAVGDEDQSIYGFRGSTPENFLGFQKKYGAEVVMLEKNFRSVPSIVDVTQRFMDGYREYPKDIRPVRDSENRVFILDNPTHQDEPSNVVGIIRALVDHGVIPHQGYVTLLFRSVKHDAVEIMNELRREGIPFNVYGEGGFFDREEILYIMHLLHHTRNERRKIIRKLKYEHLEGEFMDLTPGSVNRILDMDEEELRGLREHREFRGAGFTDPDDIRKLVALNRLIDSDLGVLERYYEILELTEYPHRLLERGDDESREKLYNLARFSSLIKDYERISLEPGVEGLMEFIRMAMSGRIKKYDQILLDNPYSVNIMTMHRAKGLEFPVVIICSVFNGKFPRKVRERSELELPEELRRSTMRTDEIEERRLFYVGMTRAQDMLIVSATKNHRGRIGYSEFIEDLIKTSRITSDRLGRIDPEDARIEIIKNSCQVEDIETREIFRISFTELNTYLTCPFRYMLLYEYGFDVPSTRDQLYGIAVHECLRRINRRLMRGEAVTDDYLQELASHALRDIEMSPDGFRAFISKLKRYLEEIRGRASEIVSAEKPFSIMKDGFMITGQTDLIIRNREGGLELVDFKSMSGSGIHARDIELQLGVYRHALDLDFDGFLAYTFEDSEWHLIEPAADIEGLLEDVAERIRREEFPPRENNLCSLCIFRSICTYINGRQEAGAGGEAEDLRRAFRDLDPHDMDGYVEAMERIMGYLRNSHDPEVRARAADYLGEAGDAVALDVLREALNDPGEGVRIAARRAIERLKKAQRALKEDYQTLICGRDLFKPKKIHTPEGQFVVCRVCGHSKFLEDGVREVVGIIGDEEYSWRQEDRLFISMWDEESKRARNADIDVLWVTDSGDMDYGWAINAVYQRLKNDVTRAKPLSEIPVILRGDPEIGEEEMDILQRFGEVRYG